MKPGFHGPGGDAEDGRRLGDRKVQVEGQDEDGPLIGRQAVQPAFELVGHGECRLMVGHMRPIVGEQREFDDASAGPPTDVLT